MFDLRINLPEFLDSPDMQEGFAARSYHFMAIVNKFFGGTKIVKHFIENEIKLRNKSVPLKILDIGSGICDIPMAICSWAQTAGINVEFTCVETNRYAIKIAQQNLIDFPNIKLIQEDVFAYQPIEKYDCATGSLFFHHLADEQIIDLINKLKMLGCKSVLMNDLHRSLRCYLGCLFASLFVGADVRHDALLSIRKGFKPAQLYQLAKMIPKSRTNVQTAWFGRVCAVIRFSEDGR